MRIAVFRALQLGDLLCAVPALRALRAAYPTARITLIGLPWAEDFVRRMPYVDELIVFPGFPGMPERSADLARLPQFFETVRARQFDLALQMHGDGRLSNPLVAAFGARRCVGFTIAGGGCPEGMASLPWPEQLSEVRRLLALMRFIDVPECGEHLELPLLSEEERGYVELRASFELEGRRYACLHPGARLATRRWPPERYAAVGDRLAQAGLDIVLTGTRGEATLAEHVRRAMRAPALDLTGHTTLGTLAALARDARLVICNDTGMSHVAAAMGTPSVVICCGADPQRFRPRDTARHRVLSHAVPCRPCSHEHCPTKHECATGVSSSMVCAAALDLLATFDGHHHVAA